jgi:hypothetical protein
MDPKSCAALLVKSLIPLANGLAGMTGSSPASRSKILNKNAVFENQLDYQVQ